MKFNLILLLSLTTSLTSGFALSNPSLKPSNLIQSSAVESSRRSSPLSLPRTLAFASPSSAFNTAQRSNSFKLNAFTPVSTNNDVSSYTSSTSGSSIALKSSVRGGDVQVNQQEKKKGLDVALLSYFLFWYIGNYYYNITNKMALRAAGGATGFPMTISSLQLGVGVMYALFLWVAPDSRPLPKVTGADIIRLLPVAFCAMGSHCASVFAMNAGAVSFAQIVKSAEPAFAAVLSHFVYKKKVSTAKWLCLPIVIGGVVLASVKELDFAWSALGSACLANMFAAVKGNENKAIMDDSSMRERFGTIGNQFALTSILAFLMSIPLMIATEGHKLSQFYGIWKTNPVVSFNLIASGLWFYGYNELATMTIKKTGAVTQSVANTAKRVIVIVGVALVLGESLDFMKLLGCGIGIGGVFLYSIIDGLVAARQKKD